MNFKLAHLSDYFFFNIMKKDYVWEADVLDPIAFKLDLPLPT